MFMLTHAHAALSVLAGKKITPIEKQLLIVGSLLPDVAELHVVPEEKTHTKGIQFMSYLGKAYRYLGLGVVLHGTEPHGLDYYTHDGFYSVDGSYTAPHGKSSGYIARCHREIMPLVVRYKKSLGRLSVDEAVHFVVEFCFDHLTAQKDRTLAPVVYEALRKSLDTNAVSNFAHFFDVNKKQMKRLKHIVRSRQNKKILMNFATIHGTAHNLQYFIFLKSLREEQKHVRYRFLGKLATVTRSSLGFFQVKVHDKALVQMFERAIEIIRRDYDEFMDETIEKMKRMVKKEKWI
ncbi:hypothetical protein HY497_00110 [Candidatus Woesearchaeota archaeon]|nr:hypothetical protein [Candidatus Woesearchaeota archaeon]